MKERYHISGMTCSACSAHVEKAVNKLEGVEKASVNLLAETMEISYEEGRLALYHFDVYRIGDVEEMEEIGYEDCFYGEGVCLVEWAELIREILPEDCIGIIIEKDLAQGFDYRKITIQR